MDTTRLTTYTISAHPRGWQIQRGGETADGETPEGIYPTKQQAVDAALAEAERTQPAAVRVFDESGLIESERVLSSGPYGPGQPQGPSGAAPGAEPPRRTAADVKKLTRNLDTFTKEELRRIPVLPEGARLEQGAVYVDLFDPRRRPFHATAQMVAGTSNCLAPKSEVPYELWNRLVG